MARRGDGVEKAGMDWAITAPCRCVDLGVGRVWLVRLKFAEVTISWLDNLE